MRIGCVIMASGEGRRFARIAGAGRNKLLADAGGMPLVVRTVRSVPAARFEVVVSTRWPEVARVLDGMAPGVPVALHEGGFRSDSVRAGLAAGDARWDGCLFVPGDQPLVSPASYEALARAFEGDPTRAWRLAWQGAPASPVLFPRACFGALMGLAGKDGGSSLLRCGAVDVSTVEAMRAEELMDVDTPEDLAAVCRALEGMAG